MSRWWPAINETVRATFLSLLTELDPELPILLLATHDSDLNYCAEDVVCLFDGDDDEIFVTALPSSVERRNFFHPVVVEKSLRAPFTKKKNREQLEVLPLAEAAPERQLNDAEKARVERNEEATLCELRIFLREILAKMARNKLFFMFTRPVDTQEVPDYLEIIHKPMDLETMMTKIDQHCYESAKDFLADIDQICANALEYNPDRDPEGDVTDPDPSTNLIFNHYVTYELFRQVDPPPSLHAAWHGLRPHQGRNGHGLRGAVSGDIAHAQSPPGYGGATCRN